MEIISMVVSVICLLLAGVISLDIPRLLKIEEYTRALVRIGTVNSCILLCIIYILLTK